MSETVSGPPVQAFAYTDVGRRSHNEDSFLVNLDAGLMIVADGVGGHQAGEIASDITCKVIEREVLAGQSLEQGIHAANLGVFAGVENELGRAGMASTVVAVHFEGSNWSVAWVGDSRAYLWDGQLGLLSRDHSLVESLVRSGQISLEEARTHPKKNVIEQAIGLQSEDNLLIGRNSGELRSGQILMLCSDGLNDVLDSASICAILDNGLSLEERCKILVETAVAEGGKDNTTCILLQPTQAIPAGSGAQPDFVWRFDPVTNSYSGLPERKPRKEATIERLAPRAPPEGTVLMKSAVAPGQAREEARKQSKQEKRQGLLWGLAALVVVGVVVAYVLTQNGTLGN